MTIHEIKSLLKDGFGYAPACKIKTFPGEHLVSISMPHGPAPTLYISYPASKDDICYAHHSSYEAFRRAA